MQLRPYQEEGAAWLAARRYGCLADEMRLGKTAQAITAASRVWDDPGGITVGVVCPASVVPVWVQQFEVWWPHGVAYTLMVNSYDMVARGAFDDHLFDVLILDEAHYLKSKDAKRTRKIFGPRCDGVGGLISKVGHVWALSGTPSPNNPSELWPMLRALAPETITRRGAAMNYWSFIQRYCVIEDNGFGQVIKGGRNLDELKAAIGPFMLRRLYADVAPEVPPLQFDVLPVEGAAPDEGDLAKLLAGASSDDEILARLNSSSPHIASLRRATGIAKVKGVLDWFKDWRLSGGGKVVFMAHHTEVIEALRSGLGPVPMITGATSAKDRIEAVRVFQEDDKCAAFIGNLQAAGTGLELSAASTLVFVESDWVPGNNLQAAMRIQSAESTTPRMVLSATLPGSIDERISAACVRKMRDSATLFG